MQQLNNITDDADQVMIFPLPDGTNLQLEFVYRPATQRWTLNLIHPTLTLNGYNLVQSPNILRPWKNVTSFGIAVTSVNGLDPMNATDFLDNTCQISILSAAEVAQVETDILAPVRLVNP